MTSAPAAWISRRITLIAASCPSKSDAAVTKRNGGLCGVTSSWSERISMADVLMTGAAPPCSLRSDSWSIESAISRNSDSRNISYLGFSAGLREGRLRFQREAIRVRAQLAEDFRDRVEIAVGQRLGREP